MDLIQNKIPENVEKIHLIAVCGTAMARLRVCSKIQALK